MRGGRHLQRSRRSLRWWLCWREYVQSAEARFTLIQEESRECCFLPWTRNGEVSTGQASCLTERRTHDASRYVMTRRDNPRRKDSSEQLTSFAGERAWNVLREAIEGVTGLKRELIAYDIILRVCRVNAPNGMYSCPLPVLTCCPIEVYCR